MSGNTLRALGLARRAGALVCGTPMICDALRSAKKPFLVVAANDISEGTRKKLTDKCGYYETPNWRLHCNLQYLVFRRCITVTSLASRGRAIPSAV